MNRYVSRRKDYVVWSLLITGLLMSLAVLIYGLSGLI